MTKYYVGYTQGNNDYVYVSNITNINVGISTTIESALGFENIELAESLKNIASSLIANQDYKVLEIKTEIKEVVE